MLTGMVSTMMAQDLDAKYATDLLPVGTKAPDLVDAKDSIHHITDFRGRCVVLDFWATWCGDCRKDLPEMKKLHQIYDLEGVEFIGISFDTDFSVLQDFMDKEHMGWRVLSELKKMKETKMANVFDAEEDESLYQIAYKTSLPNTEVSYEVYKDVEDGNPTSGTLLEKGANSHSYAGFFKIDLKDEYALKKGEKYAVVLTMKRATDENGSMVYTEVFPYSTEFSEGLTVRGVINPGESYLYSDGKWSDMTAAKDSLIERAFEQGVKEIGSRKITTKVSLESKDTFTVDNYPIKGIAAPAAKK